MILLCECSFFSPFKTESRYFSTLLCWSYQLHAACRSSDVDLCNEFCCFSLSAWKSASVPGLVSIVPICSHSYYGSSSCISHQQDTVLECAYAVTEIIQTALFSIFINDRNTKSNVTHVHICIISHSCF